MSEQAEYVMLSAWDKFVLDALLPSAHFDSCYDGFVGGWQACAEGKDKIIEQQAAEKVVGGLLAHIKHLNSRLAAIKVALGGLE